MGRFRKADTPSRLFSSDVAEKLGDDSLEIKFATGTPDTRVEIRGVDSQSPLNCIPKRALTGRFSEYAVCAGAPNTGDIINGTSMIRSMERTLVDLISDDPACLRRAPAGRASTSSTDRW